jgi:arsenate reductase|tara:strand:- start:27 stop:374 length:348 start_codon:yes stop_codon:yes gene_type:complete
MVKIYHNNRCGKSRTALKLLLEAGLEVEVIEYLKTPLSSTQLQVLVTALGITPYDLIRRGEKVFKEHYKASHPDNIDWLQAIVDHPVLMERPIIQKEGLAVIGRSPESIQKILAY